VRQIPFQTVDVFTESPFTGNPLAVITDARSLTSEEMQQIAREFNYSETTFVLPPEDPEHTARVRIFDPANELPFAGHPNVGTGFVIARAGEVLGKPVNQNELTFEEITGLVKLTPVMVDGEIRGTRFRVPGAFESLETIDPEHVAACIGLTVASIVTTDHSPLRASVGLPFAFAELDSLESLAAASPDTSGFNRANHTYPSDIDMFALFVYVRTSSEPLTLRARMFAPLSNVPEDPATGSASAAIGALLVSLESTADVNRSIVIDQGVEMGRASRINIEVMKSAGAITNVFVSGNCAFVSHGVLILKD
jgi:trans-2,3-dihydro-3-hydroxyanthranilate isomerase